MDLFGEKTAKLKFSFWTVAICEYTGVHNVDLNTSNKLENQMPYLSLSIDPQGMSVSF